MTSPAEKVKERLAIEDVVGSYVELKQAGSYLKARCPFHQEKTPSFTVSPSRGTYYCFGCGAKGDVFSFVQQFEGLDFSGALKLLAEKAGVEIVGYSGQAQKENEILYKVMEKACLFFEEQIKDNKSAIDYLKKRGLKNETIKRWRIGYAPDEWRFLLEKLAKDFDEKDIKNAGLLKEKEGRKYDTFRNRIVFPIFDTGGRVVAFSGRLFPEKEGIQAPKYLNSPESLIFNKSEILYGLNFGMDAIRKAKYSIIVEGQFDIVLSHQSGMKNTVAVSGTSLTPEHIKRLSRLSKKTVIVFDSDEAGIKASHRSILLSLSNGMEVKVAVLPEGKDPADVISSDVSEWRKALSGAVHPVEFWANLIVRRSSDKMKQLVAVREEVFPILLSMPSKMDRSFFVTKLSDWLSLDESSVISDLEQSENKNKNLVDRQQESEKNKDTSFLQKPSKDIVRTISAILVWQKTAEKPVLSEEEIVSLLSSEPELQTQVLAREEYLEEEEIFAEEIPRSNYTQVDLKKAIDELIIYYTIITLEKEFGDFQVKLKKAEKLGQSEEADRFLLLCQEISKKIETKKNKLKENGEK